ncbi:MAG TPA: alpha/beta hydrolase [Bacteroidaceae bacterium]|nr:alpha/beta hydrolase [Bacteroidaceae bacterium]
MKKIITLATLLFICSITFTQNLSGEWAGNLNIGPHSLRLIFHLSETPDGYSATMDSPDQNANGIVMSHITIDGDSLTIELRIAGMKYSGKKSGDSIRGTFSQAGQNLPLILNRRDVLVNNHKQKVSTENELFVETEVRLPIEKGNLVGTQTTPKNFAIGPLALIVAGSGPTDRDGNNPSMICDTYKKIAHELAKNDIASIRYDKRGIANSASTVDNEIDLRFDDYVNDTRLWIDLIKKDQRFSQVVLIGHSEGSLIAMLASDMANKFISISGPGRSADFLLKEQLESVPYQIRDVAYEKIDSLKNGLEVKYVPEELLSLFRPSVQPYLISWFKQDPSKIIEDMTIPIMLIHGTTDIQVTEKDFKFLTAAKPDAEQLIIENMNHILKTATLEREANLATYNDPELPLSTGLIEGIVSFINK